MTMMLLRLRIMMDNTIKGKDIGYEINVEEFVGILRDGI
jgi:hypothetical protein